MGNITSNELFRLQKIFTSILQDLNSGDVELEEAILDMGDFSTVFKISIVDGKKLRRPLNPKIQIDEGQGAEVEKKFFKSFNDAGYPDDIELDCD